MPPSFALAIVDDDPIVCALLERLLCRAMPTATIRTFASPGQLLAVLPTLAPALVIADYYLQEREMDGVVLAQTVKRLAPGTPVLLISTDDASAIYAALRDGSIDRFVQKPFNLDDLVFQVEALLPPAA